MKFEFSIKSSDSDAMLRFSDYDGDYFVVTYSRTPLTVSNRVYAYTDALGVARFFGELRKTKVPSIDKLEWASLEGEFRIAGSCDKLGHVQLTFELSDLPGHPESWSFRGGLITELGLLERISREAEEFFAG